MRKRRRERAPLRAPAKRRRNVTVMKRHEHEWTLLIRNKHVTRGKQALSDLDLMHSQRLPVGWRAPRRGQPLGQGTLGGSAIRFDHMISLRLS
eukprot:1933177-Rhodomonas_salina.1